LKCIDQSDRRGAKAGVLILRDFTVHCWDLTWGFRVETDLGQPGTRCGRLVFKWKLPNKYEKRDFEAKYASNSETFELVNYIFK